MNGSKRIAAGIVTFRVEDARPRFLLLRNRRHGTWGFPKGHREGQEDILACALREYTEETSLPAPRILTGFRHETSHMVRDPGGMVEKQITYFVAEAPASEPRLSHEHDAMAWAEFDAAMAMLQFDNLRELLRQARGAVAQDIAGRIPMTDRLERLKSLIRDVPDFPKPGILFKDISPLLADPRGLKDCIALLAERIRDLGVEMIAGPEARGFLFGAPLARELGVGFAPMRKKGKLPWKTIEESYALEYGTDTLQMHDDALKPGQRVLLVDDLLATGGTIDACRRLAAKAGARVVGAAFVIELAFLEGRQRLGGLEVRSLIVY